MEDPIESEVEPIQAPQSRPRTSLAGRITLGYLLVLVVTAAVAAAASQVPDLPAPTVFLLTLVVALPLGAWLIHRLVRPIDIVIAGVSDGIRSFHDRDFSVRLAYRRTDELGELVRLYNRVSETLQDERRVLRQRELLLQTALDRSPAAIVLINRLDRILYANQEARRLLTGGPKLEGRHFDDFRLGAPPAMREILDSETDGLFTVSEGETNETYHLSQRVFLLNRRRHRLLILRRLTGDLSRREAEIWKKVIRVISHELNNSLAPVSSLVHSLQRMARDPSKSNRVDEAFETIRERLDHLSRFIDGYARFARLPAPRLEAVSWRAFVGSLGEFPDLEVLGSLPSEPGYFDPAQMRQVLVNLLKNAYEASGEQPQVSLRVEGTAEGTYLQVKDQGRGMDDETLEKALLPFYSTKQTGTGLGLPLCREIIEAHGGKISLQRGDEAGNTVANGHGGGTVVTCWLPRLRQ